MCPKDVNPFNAYNEQYIVCALVREAKEIGDSIRCRPVRRLQCTNLTQRMICILLHLRCRYACFGDRKRARSTFKLSTTATFRASNRAAQAPASIKAPQPVSIWEILPIADAALPISDSVADIVNFKINFANHVLASAAGIASMASDKRRQREAAACFIIKATLRNSARNAVAEGSFLRKLGEQVEGGNSTLNCGSNVDTTFVCVPQSASERNCRT